jgi:ABC-type Fe3+/spermidine/putrescine transport system ATPase subunit
LGIARLGGVQGSFGVAGFHAVMRSRHLSTLFGDLRLFQHRSIRTRVGPGGRMRATAEQAAAR